jgi:hypothetical protein
MRIGLGRKGVFLEQLGNNINVLIADEKLPLKEGYRVSRYQNEPIEKILENEGITKENVYYVVQPTHYYRNKVSFPFADRVKIAGIIKFEVHDFLPTPDMEYVTDFLPLWAEPQRSTGQNFEVLSFTINKTAVREMLDSFGEYRKNLKALVPFDIAVFNCLSSIIENDTFLFLDVHEDALYLQQVSGSKLSKVVYIKKYSDEQYNNSLSSELLIMLKSSNSPLLYLNVRSSVDEQFRNLNNRIFEGLDLSYRTLPVRQYEESLNIIHDTDPSEMVALLGTLKMINQTQNKRVNLLKEEFKPRLKRDIRLKDFISVGALLLVLLLISLSNLFIDMGFNKSQAKELQRGMDELSMKVFEQAQLDGKGAEQYLMEIQNKIKLVETSVDRRYSCIELLREISTFLPDDVVIEYTDLIIERDHVKFAGMARTFSDIDRIKESLTFSEYFTEVKVSNTGTTGSSEGFAVTFVFDIDVNEEL